VRINDAAALRAADIGVDGCRGTGVADVADVVLMDDDSLDRAVEQGRTIRANISRRCGPLVDQLRRDPRRSGAGAQGSPGDIGVQYLWINLLSTSSGLARPWSRPSLTSWTNAARPARPI
jgi:hypothetical protein